MKKEYVLLGIIIGFWSFSFIIVDNLLMFITPITIAFYRFIIASFTLLLITIFEKIWKKKNSFMKNDQEIYKNNEEIIRNSNSSKKYYILILACSFLGGFLFYVVQYNAIELIGPSTSALLVCLLSPIFITILSIIYFNEKLDSLKIIGFILATIGTLILMSRGDLNNLNLFSENFFGNILGISQPIIWAVYSILLKKLTKKLTPIQIMRYVIYIGTLELFIFVIFMGELDIFIENFLNPYVILNIAYLAIIASVIGGILWASSMKKLEASKVASFLYAEPFLTLLFSFVLGIEQDILVPLFGGILILIAVIIISCG